MKIKPLFKTITLSCDNWIHNMSLERSTKSRIRVPPDTQKNKIHANFFKWCKPRQFDEQQIIYRKKSGVVVCVCVNEGVVELHRPPFFFFLNLLYRVTQNQTVTDPQGSYFHLSLQKLLRFCLLSSF